MWDKGVDGLKQSTDGILYQAHHKRWLYGILYTSILKRPHVPKWASVVRDQTLGGESLQEVFAIPVGAMKTEMAKL